MGLLTSLTLAASLLLASGATAEPVEVKVGEATLVGDYNSTLGVEAFLGVKYANHKRFERPVLVNYEGGDKIQADAHAPACSQVNNATGWNNYGNVEDCLFLEIYRPHDETKKKEKLPVLVWIHGGGGVYGAANAFLSYNFVKESVAIKKPVIVVTINYRLAAWGLLGGKEALKNGAVNLALYDQRAALEWVQRHIEDFGGDKRQVTLWGESAGSMFAHFQMLDQDTKLFRAAILQSGTMNSVPAIDTSNFQASYDGLVEAVGCKSSADTFGCLKNADLAVLQNAVNKLTAGVTTYSTRPWGPVIDGKLIKDSPSTLIAKGKFAKKPFISGDVMDEGTFFVKPTPMDTVDTMMALFQADYLNKASTWLSNNKTVSKLMELYPEDPSTGSPFGTGNETFGFGSQFKRAAALIGDIRYQAPRRAWLADAMKNGVNGWSFQLSQFAPSKTPAAYGVYHTADLAYVFMMIPPSVTEHYELSQRMVRHWVYFAYNMDPNYKGGVGWPRYGSHRNLMNFVTGDKTSVVQDTFRKEGISYLISVQDQFGNPRK